MAMSPSRPFLIAGGTGLVGRHLAAALAREGAEVVVLSRNPGRTALPGGVRAAPWRDLPALVEGAAAVVNLAGENLAQGRWSPERKRAILASRLEATGALAGAIAAAGDPPPVLVSASAVGYYGALDEPPVDERQPAGSGFLAQVCRQWEAAADAAGAAGIRVVKLRLGVVLARDGGALPRLAGPVRCFLGTALGDGRQGLSWIHIDDLVALILEAARNPGWRGAMNATAPRPASNAVFTRAVARRLGRPVLPVPAPVTRAALRLLLGEMAQAMLLEGAWVLPAAALRHGFQFRFADLDAALADLLGPAGGGS
jgi:hypothetical protein